MSRACGSASARSAGSPRSTAGARRRHRPPATADARTRAWLITRIVALGGNPDPVIVVFIRGHGSDPTPHTLALGADRPHDALQRALLETSHALGTVMGLRSPSVRWAKVAAILVVLCGLSLPVSASGKTVRYRGLRLNVPANWPVYHLTAGSRTCVRFNRHAVYLGAPSAVQDCPAHTVGRTEAILVAPATAHVAGDAATAAQSPAVTAAAAQSSQGSEAQLHLHGTEVTATWHTRPGVVARAIGVPRLTAETTSAAVARASRRPARVQRHAPAPRSSAAASTPAPASIPARRRPRPRRRPGRARDTTPSGSTSGAPTRAARSPP